MRLRLRLVVGMAVPLAFLVTVAGQQPAAQNPPKQAPALQNPTKQEPLRFRAVLQTQKQDAGAQGVLQIEIERWSTEAERESLVVLAGQTTKVAQGQNKLLNALQNMKPRTGFIRTPNSLGWDLRYTHVNVLPDGTRQIVIATDKPVSFGAAFAGAESTDYPFTLIEMRMKPDDKGEGKMLARSAVVAKDGKLVLENYGDEPIKLSEIWETDKDGKKK